LFAPGVSDREEKGVSFVPVRNHLWSFGVPVGEMRAVAEALLDGRYKGRA